MSITSAWLVSNKRVTFSSSHLEDCFSQTHPMTDQDKTQMENNLKILLLTQFKEILSYESLGSNQDDFRLTKRFN